jgi:hypothetical protein
VDPGTRANIVTESHNHFDHVDVAAIVQPYKLITTTGSFQVSGVAITGVSGYHNRGDTSLTNIIYVFDLAGIRLAQFASQGDPPTEAMLAQIDHADILIAQVCNGGSKLSFQEVRDIVTRLSVKLIILAHCDSGNTQAFSADKRAFSVVTHLGATRLATQVTNRLLLPMPTVAHQGMHRRIRDPVVLALFIRAGIPFRLHPLASPSPTLDLRPRAYCHASLLIPCLTSSRGPT